MRYSSKVILVFLLLLALAGLACGGSFSTANIGEAFISSDEAGQNRTTTFAQDEQTFYCQVILNNAPDDTVVKAVWTAVAVEGEEADLFLDENSLTGGDGQLTFSLSNDNLWPIGAYKVDIYLNDELDQTLNFTVQ